MSHTPGPWLVLEGTPKLVQAAVFSDVTGVRVADLALSNRTSPEEREANARLIAAAPHLLLAVGELLWVLDNLHREGDPEFTRQANENEQHARAAISRATGNEEEG